MKLLIFLLPLIVFSGQLEDPLLTFNPEDVRSTAEYFIQFTTASAVQSDSVIKVSFPSEFTLADSASHSCSVEVTFAQVSSVSCEAASNVITMSSAFSQALFLNAGQIVQITFQDIINPPSSSQSSPIGVSVYQVDGITLIDSLTSSDEYTVTATPSSFTTASISTDSDVIGQQTTWTFTFTPTYTILSGTQILVIFPYQNAYIGATSNDLEDFVVSNTPSCEGVTQMNSVLSCSYSNLVLTVQGGFNSDTSGQVSFTSNSILNPPSPTAVTGFSIQVVDSSGGIYEESSNTISVKVSTPGILSNLQITASPTTVSTASTYRVSFRVDNPLYSGCKLKMIVPEEIIFDSSINIKGLSVMASGDRAFEISNDDTITITDGYTQYQSFSTHFFEVAFLTNPVSTEQSPQFQFQTLTSADEVIDEGTGGSVTATAGTILQYDTNDFVIASDFTVGVVTTYTFDFETQHAVDAGAFLSITFPGEISVADRDSSTSCTSVLAGLHADSKCQVVGQDLVVYDGFPTGMAAGRITFSLDGVTNSFSTAETSSFAISTHPASGLVYEIDSISEGVTITAVPSALNSVSVSMANEMTGVVTTYTFQIDTQTTITVGGYLFITFPDEVQITDTEQAQNSCVKIQGFSTTSFECVVTSTTIRIDGFDSGNFDPGVLEFEISYVKNPPSTRKYQSFEVATHDADGNKIDETNSGIFVQPTLANSLVAASVSASSTVNGEANTYTISFTVQNTTPVNFKAKIVPPSQVSFPGSPVCGISGVVDAISCSIIQTTALQAELTLSSQISSGTEVIFTVNGVINPPTTQESDTFQFYTYTSDDYAIDQKLTGITTQTDTAATITDIVISAASSLVSAQTSYTIDYVPINPHPVGASISITIPTKFTIGTIGCTSITLDAGLSCLPSGNTVVVSGGFVSEISDPTNIDVTISGITNPATMDATQAWEILSKSGSFLIDTSTDQVSTFTCSSPCFTCQTSPTFCTSCDPDGANPFLYDDTCNASCNDGQTDVTDTTEKECVDCEEPCLYCEGATTFCTECDVTGGFPYLFDDTCNSSCQAGQYGDGTSCLNCVNPCLDCSDQTTCVSCTHRTSNPDFGAATYLDQTTSQCVVTCPDGTLANDDTFVCDQCSDDCVTCTGTIDYCESCDVSSGLKLLEGSCIASCPDDGRYIEIDDVCERCTGDCDTCQIDLNTCTSCLNDKFLYANTCQDSCPTGTVTVGFKCRNCQSPCDTCTGGTTTCTTCQDTYLLEGTSCVSECSDGYLSDGVNCNQCDQSCQTCATTTTQCTSCEIGTFLHDQQCLTQCPSDFYVYGDKVCERCDSNCLACSGTTTFCISCVGGKKLYNNVCQDQCPAGTTIEIDSVCYDCDDECLTCTGDVNTCASCQVDQFLQDGGCVSSCSGGYIENGTNCQACDDVCFTCSGSTSTCTSCPTNNYLYLDTCRDSCPEGWMPSSGVCVEIEDSQECAPGCTDDLTENSTCESECNIQACAFDNGMCNKGETNCADGEYQVGDGCLSCQSPCNLCQAPAYCLSCEIDSSTGQLKLLYDNFCYTECPTGTVKVSDLVCSDCDFGCSECVGDTSTCTACETNYLLYNNQCITQCISGTTIESDDGLSCDDCSSNCEQCQTTVDNCTSCPDGKVLQEGTCQNQCDSGYTTTTTSPSTCRACSGCLECFEQTTTCTSCVAQEFLYEGECVTQCPTGTYESGTQCKVCEDSCISCSGAANCSVCANNYVKFETLCLNQCPSGYSDVNGTCEVITTSDTCAPDCTDELLANDACDDECNLDVCNLDNQACAHSGECPAGEYYTGSECEECQYPCQTCTSSVTCTSCDPHITTGQTMLLYDDDCYQTCPDGTLKSSPYCLDCDDACLTCASDVSTCISCEGGEFLYEGTCVNSCPTDTTVELGSICQQCDVDCATCQVNSGNCTSCNDDRVLQGNQCKVLCDDGFTTTSIFPDTCQECSGDCLTCSGQTYTCTSCQSDMFFANEQCFSECPENISVIVGDACVECQAPCATCVTTTTTCTACDTGYNLYISECVVDCPSGFEAILGACTAFCAEGCSNDLLTNQDCDVACNAVQCAYDNGMCQQDTSCQAGEYQDGNDCAECTYPCNTCASSVYCTSCEISNVTGLQLYLYAGSCYDQCPAGSFQNGIICEDCDDSCKECQTDATTCTACQTLKLYENECLISCPNGTTIESDGVCYDCDNNCQTCTGDIYTCDSCVDSLVLSQGQCVSLCEDGQTTTATSNGECVDCSDNCLTCVTTTTTCTSCNGNILHQDQCIDTCPSGYTNTNTDPYICTECSSDCLECQSSISNCTACQGGLYLTSSNTCQAETECPDGQTTTPDTGGVCQTCDQKCLTCQNSVDNCLSCIQGLVLVSNQCLECTSPCQDCQGLQTACTACIQGYYLSGTACLECDSNCRTCQTNSFTCTACYQGFRLSSTTCLECKQGCQTCDDDVSVCTSCEDGLFLQDGSCVECDPTCLTCEGFSDTCTSCEDGRFLSSTDSCQACDSSCKTCENLATECTDCDQGLTLISGECGACDSQCLTCVVDFNTCDTCEDGLDLVDGKCGICNSNCATCTGDFNTCESCDEDKYLDQDDLACYSCNSECEQCQGSPERCISCRDGDVLINNTCLSCNEPCETCSTTQDNCDSCQEGLSVIGTTCLACDPDSECSECSGDIYTCIECYDGWYILGTNCIRCDSNCATCQDNAQNCVSCPPGSQLQVSVCTQVCIEGKVFVDGACTDCSTNCQTCATTVDNCTSCYSGILFSGQCLQQCPQGYYLSGDQCLICSGLCKQCETSSSNCISCQNGFYLSNGSCFQICNDGEYYDGSTCQDCSSNCLTCSGSATNCESCPNEDQVVNGDGECEVPCDEGFTRTSDSGDLCVACSEQCSTCQDEIDYCTGCSSSNMNLYKGLCLYECPENTTVEIGLVCQDCDSSCLTCEETPFTCTSCSSSTVLYASTCIDDCPDNWYENLGVCQECQDPNNCPPVDSDSDQDGDQDDTSSGDDQSDDEFEPGPAPFPFTGFTAITAGVILIAKVSATGGSFIPASIGVWGLSAACSWVFLVVYIPVDEEQGRRLAIDPSGGSLTKSVCILLILGALLFHIICNVIFFVVFCRKIYTKDRTFKYWREQHKCMTNTTLILCGFSFHCVRFFFCSMCNKSLFKAEFTKKSKIYKLLIRLGYVSILCTCVPIIVAQMLLLIEYDLGDFMWMFSLDSLIVTILLTFMLVIDMIQMEKLLVRYQTDKEIGKDFGKRIAAPDVSFEEVIKQFPYPISDIMPLKPLQARKKITKGRSQTPPESRCYSPLPKDILEAVVERKNSFPLDDKNHVQIDPYLFEQYQPNPDILDSEPGAELEDTGKPENSFFDEEPTAFDIDLHTQGEFQFANRIFKNPIQRPAQVDYVALSLDPRTEEYTEIIAFTQQQSESQQEPNLEQFQNLIVPSVDHQMTAELGTIEEEDEIELERAIADSNDPEVVSVPHRRTGQRVKIRKGFRGARIVDLENHVVQGAPPIDTVKYHIPFTIVDQNDVRFATLTAHSGEKIRVQRNFRGARIVDLEKKIQNPNSHLIGQVVKKEEDFEFYNAYPDPEDPQVVVVPHKPTGEDVKVKKTFHGAQVIDEYGDIIPGVPFIDKNDYDIPKTIVDQQDVHLATLKHKITQARVRVRRHFRGAKIVDLERKVDHPRPPMKMNTDYSEPESLGPEFSEEYTSPKAGWITPKIPEVQMFDYKPSKPQRHTKISPAQPREIDPARERLANLGNIIATYQDPKRWDSDEEIFPMEPNFEQFDSSDQYAPNSGRRNYQFERPLQVDDSSSSIQSGIGGRKRRRKKKNKIPREFSGRMKGLQNIYLQRLDNRKKEIRPNRIGADIFEPDMEEDDEPQFRQYYGTDRGILPSVGEDIVYGRSGRKEF